MYLKHKTWGQDWIDHHGGLKQLVGGFCVRVREEFTTRRLGQKELGDLGGGGEERERKGERERERERRGREGERKEEEREKEREGVREIMEYYVCIRYGILQVKAGIMNT